jgi:hypothetical protein
MVNSSNLGHFSQILMYFHQAMSGKPYGPYQGEISPGPSMPFRLLSCLILYNSIFYTLINNLEDARANTVDR